MSNVFFLTDKYVVDSGKDNVEQEKGVRCLENED
jgi:hypothetical protein